MTEIIVIIISYILGSIPFAYIIVRINTKQDIRKFGTGNVGARNSLDATGKKWIGITVLILDVLKGLAAVYITMLTTNNDFLAISLSSIFAIIGHNYSIFMKFKGGRGLATAVGVSLLIAPVLIICWLLMWIFGFFAIKRDVHTGNIIALTTAPLFFYLQPDFILQSTSTINLPSIFYLKMLALIICIIIFIKHSVYVKNIFAKKADE